MQQVAHDLVLLLQLALGDLQRDDGVVDVALGVGGEAGNVPGFPAFPRSTTWT
jgi:hypothetical protein